MLTKEKIISVLQTVKDPEIDLDIYTMGLIYDILITDDGVKIIMTYTSPFCPWGPQLQEEIKAALEKAGVKKIELELVFDPPYQMPEELRTTLGI